jgi:hypothetical protein
MHGSNFVAIHNDTFPTQHLAFTLCPSEAGNNAFRQPCMFLLGDSRENRNSSGLTTCPPVDAAATARDSAHPFDRAA